MINLRASEVVALAAEYLFRKDEYRKNDQSNKLLDDMSFAEEQLRKHPLVAAQLEYYR